MFEGNTNVIIDSNVIKTLRALVACLIRSDTSLVFRYIYFYNCGHLICEQIKYQFVGLFKQ